MNCPNCGAPVDIDASLCANCGVVLNPGQGVNGVYTTQQSAPAQQYGPAPAQTYHSQPAVKKVDYQEHAAAKSCLVMGILGIAFSTSTYLAVVGIIFSIIGLARSGKYLKTYGRLTAKPRVGRILSIVGLALGIFCTVLISIAIIVGIAGTIFNSGSYSSYYRYY